MSAKPTTDDERRTWLRLRQLSGERDRAADERNQLRLQLRGAAFAGPAWPGPPVPELRARLEMANATWNRLVDEIRNIHDADRPPSLINRVGPPLGGILRPNVPIMRVGRR
jgi:hypothetical protein